MSALGAFWETGEPAGYSSSHRLVTLQMFEEFMQHRRISIKDILFSFIVKIYSALSFKNHSEVFIICQN